MKLWERVIFLIYTIFKVILIAGFIGSSLAERLLSEYDDITFIGIDNMNDYYDVNLKWTRIHKLISGTPLREGLGKYVERYKWFYIA